MITYFSIIAFTISSLFMTSVDGISEPTIINIDVLDHSRTKEEANFICDKLQFEEWIRSQGYTIIIGQPYRSHIKELYYDTDKNRWEEKQLEYDRLDTEITIVAPDGHVLSTFEELKPFGEYWASLNENNYWDDTI